MFDKGKVFLYRRGPKDSKEASYFPREKPTDKKIVREREELVRIYSGLSNFQVGDFLLAVQWQNLSRGKESELLEKIDKIVSEKPGIREVSQ
jgi:hypothetical protein